MSVARPAVCPAHVGRGPEIACVGSAVSSASDGGAVIVILGEAGLGKSRLAGEAVRFAHAHGLLVLSGACTERAQAAYAPLATALRHHTRDLETADLEELFGGPARLACALLPEVAAALGVELATSHVGAHQLFAAVWQVMRRLTRDRPALLVAEDTHWADADTADMLLHLSREAPELHLCLLLTARPEELAVGHPMVHTLSQLRRLAWTSEVQLQPLGPAGVRTMVGALLGGDVEEAVVGSVVTRAGGIPYFIEELCAGFVDGPADGLSPHGRRGAGTDGLPASIRDAVLSRMSTLDGETAEVLRLAAVAGERVDPSVVAQAAGRDLEAVELALSRGVDRRLLVETRDDGLGGGFAFRHALTRDVLLAEITGPERRAAHRRVAAATQTLRAHDLGTVAADLCRHYCEANEPAQAIEFAQVAARHAAGRVAPAAAVSHYDTALRLAPAAGCDELPILLEAAWTTFERGSRHRLSEFAGRARRLAQQRGDPVSLATALDLLSKDLYHEGRVDEAITLSEEALALSSGRDDWVESTMLEMLAFLRHRARRDGVRPLVERGLTLARSSANVVVEANLEDLMADDAPTLEESAAASGRAVRAARAAGPPWDVVVLTHAARRALRNGCLASARELAREAVGASEWASEWRDGAEVAIGCVDALSGFLADARRRLEPFLDGINVPETRWVVFALVEVYVRRGDPAAARRMCECVSHRSGLGIDDHELMREVHLRLLMHDDDDDARRHAERLVAGSPGLRSTTLPLTAPDVARYLLRRGEGALLERFVAGLAGILRAGSPLGDAVREFVGGLLALHDAAYDDAAGRLRASADLFGDLPMPARQVEALHGLAAAQSGAGHRRQAASTLLRAYHIAGHIGARALTDETAAALRALGVRLHASRGRDSVGDGLSAREAEVAALIAQGCNNAEIARQLHLSPKTAANHVSNILAKLEFRSRTEIARWAAQQDLLGQSDRSRTVRSRGR